MAGGAGVCRGNGAGGYAQALEPQHFDMETLPLLLAPLACWVLAVTLIHEERLIGDEQYWLTRPYTWKDLVAAKALFLVVFVNVPLFVCQSRRWRRPGFRLGSGCRCCFGGRSSFPYSS